MPTRSVAVPAVMHGMVEGFAALSHPSPSFCLLCSGRDRHICAVSEPRRSVVAASCAQEAKKLFEEKFKSGKNRWFFSKLRF